MVNILNFKRLISWEHVNLRADQILFSISSTRLWTIELKKIKTCKNKKHVILKVEILRLLVKIIGFYGLPGNDASQKC